MGSNQHLRTRIICLEKKDSSLAVDVCKDLTKLKGVEYAHSIANHRLKLKYSLEYLSFELIEALLKELGYGLDSSVPARIRRYYYQYMEDNVRESLAIRSDKHELSCSVDPNEAKNPEQYWDEYR